MGVQRVGRPRREDVGISAQVPTFPLSEEPTEALFDDEAVESVPQEAEMLFEDAPVVVEPIPAEIIAVDRDLTPDQRKEFEELLNKRMTLNERAECLVRLARMRGTKTAAVGLRALMEINRVTRISSERPSEAPAMFQLPEGTAVSVRVEKVEK